MFSTSLIEQCCTVYVTSIEMLNSFGHVLRYCKTKLFSTILTDVEYLRGHIFDQNSLRHLSGE